MRQRLARVSILVLMLLAATVLCGATQTVAQPTPNSPILGGYTTPTGAPPANNPPAAVAPPSGDSYPRYTSPVVVPPPADQPMLVAPKPGAPQYAPAQSYGTSGYSTLPPAGDRYGATQPPVGGLPYAKLPPKPGVPAKPPFQKPLGLPGAPKPPWGNLGEVAVNVALHLLSGNNTNLLSGLDPVILARNKVNLLSGNKPKLKDSSPFSFMSGNKLEIRINGSFNNNRDSGNSNPNPEPPADEGPAPGAKTGNKVSVLRAVDAPAPAGRPVRSNAVSPSERFKQLDLNGDGVITLEEYLRATAE